MRALLGKLRRRIGRARPQPVILMYHRIAAPLVDPWGLAVQPAHFEEHLAILRRSRRALPMSEFFDRLERRTLPDNAVAVTFDDGYADNLREAKPRLTAADIPATLFLTTGTVGQRTEYWWDELARGILLHQGSLDCELSVAGEPCRLAVPPADEAEPTRCWRAWEEPKTTRQAAYLEVWRRLRVLVADEREVVMRRLRNMFNAPHSEAADLPMSEGEVAELAAGPVFEVGGHTVTHPVLTTLPVGERRREILNGKIACERLVNRSIAGFAYPHGALDIDSQTAVRECGFAWACSTESRAVPSRGYDSYALPRLAALDWDGATFEHILEAAGA